MSQHLIRPQWKKVVDGATVTTSTESSSFELPYADTYNLVFILASVTGTSPTLNILFQFSPDDGTTWIDAPIQSSQHTNAATEFFVFKPRLGDNEVALGQEVTGTSLIAKNFVPARTARVKYTVGGTSPSFGVTVWLGTQSRSL